MREDNLRRKRRQDRGLARVEVTFRGPRRPRQPLAFASEEQRRGECSLRRVRRPRKRGNRAAFDGRTAWKPHDSRECVKDAAPFASTNESRIRGFDFGRLVCRIAARNHATVPLPVLDVHPDHR